MNKIKSKYKVGDIIVLNLSYSITVFKVESIRLSENSHGIITDPNLYYYNLIGLGEIKQLDNGKNPHRMETRHYNPFIHYLDKAKISRKATKVEKLLFAKEVV